jgi:ubiquinone/menaquinone biosynthesis C-methylase UbiE
VSTPTTFREDPKQAAIDQWTADPCGLIEGEPGTRDYFVRLLVARDDYVYGGSNGQWMAELLDYNGAAGLRVLDVGSGQGTDLYRYADAGAQATGMDLTPRHVELARAHLAAMGTTGEVVEGDAEAMPFPDSTFDRVSSNGVLHHTPDMPAALAEIRRVLKPGGRATIIVYHRDSIFFWAWKVLREGIIHRRLLHGGIDDLLTTVEVSSVDAKPLVKVYSRGQLRRMMTAAGLVNVRLFIRHDSSGLPRFRPLRGFLGRHAGWYVVAAARTPEHDG